MAEGIVETPVAPGVSGQGDGQGSGGGNLLPGQGPGGSGGQAPGQGSGTPAFDAQKAYDGLRSQGDQRYNETKMALDKILQTIGTITRQPAPSNGQQPTQSDKLSKVAESLGLDEVGATNLKSLIEEMYGPVNAQTEWLKEQMERQEFFARYPSFRQHEAQLLDIDKQLESGEMSVMNLKAMAFIGMNAQKLVEDARKSGFEEGAKSERKKISASGNAGAGARPGATAEDRLKATSEIFGSKNPQFTNKPLDD